VAEKGNLVDDPRAAGEVRRYSTWRTIRQQNVAEHTWQVLRILLTIWPAAPRNVIIHAVVHDMGEMSGDIQYPFKNMFPELRAGADKAENYVQNRQRISVFERAVFKLCDNLEMLEFGMVEVNMGNKYGRIIMDRMQHATSDCMQTLHDMRDTKQFQDNEGVFAAAQRYIKNRMEIDNGF
jgi:5'-deoxynucleotidase YfbR-like HD superfamily hydrolase